MIVSMTGFGKAVKQVKSVNVTIEVRSINSKYLDIQSRLPVVFQDKESELKEIILHKLSRGKIQISITLDKNLTNTVNLQIQKEAIGEYKNLLEQIKNEIGSNEQIKIEHLLKFSEIFTVEENNELTNEWDNVKKIINSALTDLFKMKCLEGNSLEKDIMKRVSNIGTLLEKSSKLSKKNISDSKSKLKTKVLNLAKDIVKIDSTRLEYELSLFNDKMDITEEIVRSKSHIDYFRKCVKEKELSGRRLNFLVQEMNREINTIASKSNHSKISQNAVEMKEELEKIREQLQNVE